MSPKESADKAPALCLDDGVSVEAESVEMSKMLFSALRFKPSVDLDVRLVPGVELSASLSGIEEEGIQNAPDMTEPIPEDMRDEVDVRFESTLGARVEVDSRGRTLSPLDVVDVDNRLFRPGMMDPKRMGGKGFSTDERRSG